MNNERFDKHVLYYSYTGKKVSIKKLNLSQGTGTMIKEKKVLDINITLKAPGIFFRAIIKATPLSEEELNVDASCLVVKTIKKQEKFERKEETPNRLNL